MSDLTNLERIKFEKLFGMKTGYVLNFSNRSFSDFVLNSTNINIYDEKYNKNTGSKANRLRAFWENEPNVVVGKLLSDILKYYELDEWPDIQQDLLKDCQLITHRLLQISPVENIDVIAPIENEKEFELLSQSIREDIDKNQPEAGLDRLHTYVVKYVRTLAQNRGVSIEKSKPLHSIFGEYLKKLRENGLVESTMTEEILKSTIKIFEEFNHVRNDRSLAHDNPLLNQDESILIFNNICNTIKFINSLEIKNTIDSSKINNDILDDHAKY